MTLRLGLILGALAACVVLIGVTLRSCEDVAEARRERDAALSQSTLNVGTGAIADRVASERVIIIEKTEEAARVVEVIPSDNIPADVLDGWRSGLRYQAGGPDAEPAGELPATVPSPEP